MDPQSHQDKDLNPQDGGTHQDIAQQDGSDANDAGSDSRRSGGEQ